MFDQIAQTEACPADQDPTRDAPRAFRALVAAFFSAHDDDVGVDWEEVFDVRN